MLRLENICKEYNQGELSVTALNNINLSVLEGEFVSIMGSEYGWSNFSGRIYRR